MNRDLFLAILSMDSYNRGYNAGLIGLADTGQIGNATLAPATAAQQTGWQSAGFYALAYDVSGVAGFGAGERVIAYRGSDAFGVLNPWGSGDFWNGYGIAFGSFDGPQAALAVEFYKAVAGAGGVNPATRTSNISVTGHSLGAGLSGLVAGIFNLNGVHFDPLALDLDGNGYDLIARDYSEVFFEFDTDGFAEHSGWIGGNDNGPVHERMAA